jgi:hypothetical protein
MNNTHRVVLLSVAATWPGLAGCGSGGVTDGGSAGSATTTGGHGAAGGGSSTGGTTGTAGSGGTASGLFVGSCDQPADGLCTELYCADQATCTTAAEGQSVCSAASGAWTTTKCTSAGSLAACDIVGGGDHGITMFYSPMTTTTAQSYCDSVGGTLKIP